MHKTMSVRFAVDEMERLETLAQFDGVAVAEEIREAVNLLIEQRRNDRAFRARVAEALERTRALLNEADAEDLANELKI